MSDGDHQRQVRAAEALARLQADAKIIDDLTVRAEAAEAERDELRAVVWGETKMRARIAGARSARDEAVAERDRLRAAVVDWLDAVVRAESPAVTQAALDHLGAMVGWQLDGTSRSITRPASGRSTESAREA